jgi:hypothetical protein
MRHVITLINNNFAEHYHSEVYAQWLVVPYSSCSEITYESLPGVRSLTELIWKRNTYLMKGNLHKTYRRRLSLQQIGIHALAGFYSISIIYYY